MRTLNILFVLLTIVFVIYLLIPLSTLPPDLPNSVKSLEPADLEDPYRVGFYTDMTRDEVINYYRGKFALSSLGISMPFVRLNYPPEEAQDKIRDQTHSTFLEEIVHPFRDSLYINGYEPDPEKSPLFYDGLQWRQKIIIKYVDSSLIVRETLGLTSLALAYVLFIEWKSVLKWKKN